MANGFFQLICSPAGTALKITAPTEGGMPVSAKEIVEYLVTNSIMFDSAVLNKGLQDAFASEKTEYTFALNREACSEVRESYSLQISEDKMTVTVRFYPPSSKGDRMSAMEFFTDLDYKKIKFGIIKKAVWKYFEMPEYCTDIVVAQGQPPRHGTDARIDYFFRTELNAKPTLKEDGSVDFFHLNTICTCNKGDVLAKLIPEDKGDMGTNVYGEPVRPRDVKSAVLKYERNVKLSEDKLTLFADTDGHVMLVGDKIFVSNIMTVENVDVSTGNIDYDGSVQVNGNVCTNFEVKAKGNIIVKGIVEGAYLETDGDIIITRGMNGMARGILKAEGNIVAKFIENAKVTAGGYISTEAIIHSEVSAGSSITVTGKKGFIIGGRASAGSLVSVKTLGSSMGADTIVEVGMDPGIKERMQELQKTIADNQKVLMQIKPVIAAMKTKLARGVKLAPEQLKNLKDMLQKEEAIKTTIEKDTRELEQFQVLVSKSNAASVEVTGEVFAGTKICISDASMVVKSAFHYCKFIKESGDVKMTAL